MRVDELVATYDLQVQWLPFPLHPRIPEDGVPLLQVFAGREAYVQAVGQRLREMCAEAGLELGPVGSLETIYNTRRAQELALWADAQQGGEGIHLALFRAVFVDGVNVAKLDELVRIAGEVGLDAEAARVALETRAYSDAVEAHWREASSQMISGVPAFVAGTMTVVGAQPMEIMVRLIERAGGQRRA